MINLLTLKVCHILDDQKYHRIFCYLKLFQNLFQAYILTFSFTGVKDPVMKRNRRRTLEERKNPLVVKKEEMLKKQGIVK